MEMHYYTVEVFDHNNIWRRLLFTGRRSMTLNEDEALELLHIQMKEHPYVPCRIGRHVTHIEYYVYPGERS